jgi:hypothetical protein
MVRAYESSVCIVNDNGPAAFDVNTSTITAGFNLAYDGASGFGINSTISFITPPGYKPIGPVSIWCAAPTYVAARGW